MSFVPYYNEPVLFTLERSMPIFEYKCGNCGALTEFLEAVKSKATHICEKCGSADMKKILSTFAPMVKQRGGGGKCDSCPEHKCPYSS